MIPGRPPRYKHVGLLHGVITWVFRQKRTRPRRASSRILRGRTTSFSGRFEGIACRGSGGRRGGPRFDVRYGGEGPANALNRRTRFRWGTLDGNKTDLSVTVLEQDWHDTADALKLDTLGNWDAVRVDPDGDDKASC